MLITLALGVLVGAILGLTGAGGGMLAVPALVVGLGWSMQQAAPVALIAVAGSAALGAAEGLHRKLVRYRAAAVMAVVGIAATSLGIRAAEVLSQRMLLVLFALVMLLVAFRLWTRAVAEPLSLPDAGSVIARLDATTGRLRWTWPTALLLAGIGALTGFMTGLLGVGGGFVVVPLLRRFTNISMHGIVATSLLVIALVGVGGVLSAVLHGAALPGELTFLFTSATAAGMLVGRYASRRLAATQVQASFAVILLCVSVCLLLKAAVNF